MSVEIEYICDTCREPKDAKDVLAVHFANNKEFNLIKIGSVGFRDHKGVHVCEKCLEQYRKLR